MLFSTRKTDLGPVYLAEYDSPADMASDKRFRPLFVGDSWSGTRGMTEEQVRRQAALGDEKLAAQAQEYLGKIQASLDTDRPVWAREVFGAFPVVPEALIGLPDSMRTRRNVLSDRAPVNIVLDLTISAGIDHDTIAKRGSAYLALVMELSRDRPVSLRVMSAVGEGGFAWAAVTRIKTDPLDIASAAYALTSPAFSRCLGYGGAGYRKAKQKHHDAFPDWDPKHVYISGWPFDWAPSEKGAAKAAEALRAALDLGPRDLMTRGLHLSDPCVKDPVGWINGQLAKFAAQDAEEEVAR